MTCACAGLGFVRAAACRYVHQPSCARFRCKNSWPPGCSVEPIGIARFRLPGSLGCASSLCGFRIPVAALVGAVPREVSGFVPRRVSPLPMRVFRVATGEGRLWPVIPSRCFGCHLALSWTPSHVCLRVPACVGLMSACCRLSACCRRRSLGT